MSIKENTYGQNFLLITFIIFVFSLSILYVNRNQSYTKYERIQFESAGANLHANLYYPSKDLDFQEKHPLIIYSHGIGSQRDIDIRPSIELTKRGFFVVTIDYQGHGESGGDITNIDNESNIPALAQDLSKFLDILENKEVYRNQVNPNQIGLIGHSLGGMVTLMNAALDPRFKVIVTWAALVNPDPQLFGISKENLFVQYLPVNLLQNYKVRNLLAFHHINDQLLNFTENALVLQKITGCKLVKVEEEGISDPHSLFYEEVIIGTIEWFEDNFFPSSIINESIRISYWINYLLIGISLLSLFACVIAIIRFAANFFTFENISSTYKKQKVGEDYMKSEIYNKILKIGVSFSIFLLIFEITFIFFDLLSLILAPMVLILFYIIIKSILYLKHPEKKGEKLSMFKNKVKFQLRIKVLGYALFSTFTFLTIYTFFSLSYPFAFFFPTRIIDTVLALGIYPLYMAMEIFYRKVIYPLLDFIPSHKHRIYIITILSIINHLFIMAFEPNLFIINSILVTYLISLAVVVINSLIYERTEKFSSVILTSFLIIQVFFGAAVHQALGVQSFLFNFL